MIDAKSPRDSNGHSGAETSASLDNRLGERSADPGLVAVANRIAPVVLAQQRRLEVLPALAQVMPQGLQRGTTLGVSGHGALSLGLALAAGPVRAGSWLAAVGYEELCLVAMEQAGVVLHRTVLITQPPRVSWGTVVATLFDAFDVVLLSGAYKARARDVRPLLARARERGSVIIDIGGVWPEAHDTVLESAGQVWSGVGNGHGSLTARQLTVRVSGRRRGRPYEVPLLLPGSGAAPEAVATELADTRSPLREVG